MPPPVVIERQRATASADARAEATVDASAPSQSLAVNRTLQIATAMFEHSADAITITDHLNRIVSVNRAFTAITGYELDEVAGRNPRVLSSGRHDKAFYQAMWGALHERGAWEGEVWNRRKNGQCYPERLRISVVRDGDGRIVHHIAMFSDVSQSKAVEAHIHQLACFDTLTGLPNRATARERTEVAIAQAAATGRRVAVLYLDLDHFKVVNDSLGHHVGDRLLQMMAARLRRVGRAGDTLVRLGGDEFMLLMPDLASRDEAAAMAAKVERLVSEVVEVDGHALRVTPSVGISMYPEDAGDYDTLLRNADAALYQAKRSGRNTHHFYNPQLHHDASQRLRLEHDMRAALAAGDQFRLHYQPQVRLADGALVSHEALLRWQHPRHGAVSPAQFIPVAEESGFIVELGEWVLREACRQRRAWQDAGHAALPVAVNVSATQFQRPGFYDTVTAALADSGLAADCLELELTEGIVMDNAQSAIDLLQRLRALGVRLAIDDFGTGYSSLGYLRRLPIDKLKIDQTFVRGIEHERADRAITHAVITLARNLGLDVVAEGVETATQADALRALGCAGAQGWHFGRPAPAEAVVFARTEAGVTSPAPAS